MPLALLSEAVRRALDAYVRLLRKRPGVVLVREQRDPSLQQELLGATHPREGSGLESLRSDTP